MAAERLYYDAPTLEFKATVSDIRLVSVDRADSGEKVQLWQVALDRTAFYPESGGQPWDTGTLTAVARSGAVLEVPVERVEEDDAGEVWHTVRKPLIEGTELTGRIDAARRMDHMQQHTGQHLLSAVFLKLYRMRTVSFHLGAESSTIDLQIPEGGSRLEADQVLEIEAEVNRLIFENRPVRPAWHTRQEAEAMLAEGKLPKLPEREGPMRVVEMEGVEFNACGGTHVAATGAIGGLLLRKVESGKAGSTRVEFVCGRRAVRAARRDFGLLGEAAGLLSVGVADVPGRIGALLQDVKAGAKERKGLLGELAALEAAQLAGSADPAVPVSAVFQGRDVDFAKRVASEVQAKGFAAVVGATQGEAGAVVFARKPGSEVHAGNLLREVLSAAGARGGGSADLAQGVCEAGQVQSLVQAFTGKVS